MAGGHAWCLRGMCGGRGGMRGGGGACVVAGTCMVVEGHVWWQGGVCGI